MTVLSFLSIFVIILSLLRLINLWFNPRILSHPLFKEKPDKFHFTMSYLVLILFLGAITMNKHDGNKTIT